MNLGFRIAWFQYQKLKIFPFEYLVLKAGISGREKDFCPSSRDWFEGFFFGPRTESKCAKLRDWIEGGHWKLERGGWIIINDKIFTTPNKENRTLQLHPPSDFFPFFSLLFSFLITPDFWSWRPCFCCLISKGVVGPLEGKKRATPSSN